MANYENHPPEDIQKAVSRVKKVEDFIRDSIADNHEILFHSGYKDIDNLLKEGIAPEMGEWVKEVLSGATDNDEFVNEIVDDEHNNVAYYSKTPNWVSMKASRETENHVSEMKIDDIIEKGQLCILAVEIDEDDTDFKIVKEAKSGAPVSEYLFWGVEADSELPFGVESGDIYTHGHFIPDCTLTGLDLVLFLARNYPEENLLAEPITEILSVYPDAKVAHQYDLFEDESLNLFLKSKTLNYQLVKGEDLYDFMSENKSIIGHFNPSPVNRDFILATNMDNKTVGFATIFDSEKGLDKVKDVVSLSNIEVHEGYRNKGVATEMFSMVMNEVIKRDKILKRTSPTELGSLYTKDKFTEMLKSSSVLYIEENLYFLYSRLDKKIFQNKNYSKNEKIDIMHKFEKDILNLPYMKEKGIEKLSSGYLDIVDEFIDKSLEKENKFRPRKKF